MADMTPDQAREALAAADGARQRVADEVGLPRTYWWVMAAAWVILGVLGDLGPAWLATVATIVFAVGHSAAAARLLNGRRRTPRLQVRADVAGRRVPAVVIGMLIALVALTIGAALLLAADGAEHAAIWAAVIVAAIVGFGGPEIFRTLCRWARI
ncbi:hypothetical protein AAFP35_11285 [Gordonia sp. CPCC 206044]|uniref:hypothetical protein n=1 Tax=Gordonia sp. CPCC 206044 TaxID=3140793 RepID=UPI003AF3B61A